MLNNVFLGSSIECEVIKKDKQMKILENKVLSDVKDTWD